MSGNGSVADGVRARLSTSLEAFWVSVPVATGRVPYEDFVPVLKAVDEDWVRWLRDRPATERDRFALEPITPEFFAETLWAAIDSALETWEIDHAQASNDERYAMRKQVVEQYDHRIRVYANGMLRSLDCKDPGIGRVFTESEMNAYRDAWVAVREAHEVEVGPAVERAGHDAVVPVEGQAGVPGTPEWTGAAKIVDLGSQLGN